MSLEKIIAISGKPGLYELISQTRGGFLVTSLLNGKKQSIGMQNNVSVLTEIAIYTYGEEIPLKKVFATIYEKENGEATISHKASKNELENFLREVLPEYDEERVYASDIKKIAQWYNLLQKHGYLNEALFKEEEKEEETVTENTVAEEQPENNAK